MAGEDTTTRDTTTQDGAGRWESTAAWRELMTTMQSIDDRFLQGDKAVTDEQSVAEGYRFLATIFAVAMDIYLFSDPARPRFFDINTPDRRDRMWGGDNNDAYYCFAPVDPARTYRVWGTAGDSAYFSLTVYNEPEPGQWSNRVVGIVNDHDLAIDARGGFEFWMGPERPGGYDGPFIRLDEDAAAAVTRDYVVHPASDARVQWHIESLDPPAVHRSSDAVTARGLRAAQRWILEQFAIVPIPVQAPAETNRTTEGHNSPVGANVMAEPYQVPDANYGWSARDACYSFGTYSLQPEEALVITHTPPRCRFWNLNLWNPYMAGYHAEYEPSSLNHGSAVPNRDGTITVVISRTLGTHPNALSTHGHGGGMLAFRWFQADHVPATPVCQVMSVADAPTAPT